MLYDLYLEITQLSYSEFVQTFYAGITKDATTKIVIAMLFFYLGRISRYKLDPEENRKLKQICRWEKRPMRYQIKHILEMFLEHYTNKNNINWDKISY